MSDKTIPLPHAAKPDQNVHNDRGDHDGHDGISAPTPPPEPDAITQRTNESILLRSGYALACQHVNGEDVLSITGLDGSVCLKMTLGKDGPIVEMKARSLRLAATEELSLDCERMQLNARSEMTIRSANLSEIVDEHVNIRAGGLIQSEAHAQKHRARLGDIELVANDDVALHGEQIRLNSPRPGSPPASWPTLTQPTAAPAAATPALEPPQAPAAPALAESQSGDQRTDGPLPASSAPTRNQPR